MGNSLAHHSFDLEFSAVQAPCIASAERAYTMPSSFFDKRLTDFFTMKDKANG